MKQIIFNLEPEDYKKLKLKAVENDSNMSEIIRNLIKEFLNK